jgi:hypothetical protein
MTITEARESLWRPSIEDAKAEILGPEQLYAPVPLVNLAEGQLVPIIREMEHLLESAADHVRIDNAAFIHMRYVRDGYVDESVVAMEDVLGSQFFSNACNRFVERYERIFAERGITAPSPA